MSRNLRDVIVSLSIANLCLLSPWLILLNPYHYTYYFWKSDPGFVEISSLVAAVLCLASVFWLVAFLLRRWRNRFALTMLRFGFLIVLVWPINSFLLDYWKVSVFGAATKGRLWVIGIGTIALVAAVLLYRYQRKLAGRALTLLVILSPLLFVNLGVAVYLRLKRGPTPVVNTSNKSPRLEAGRADGPRLVWIIFDELQQESVFANRRADIRLPEFVRLLNESIHFSNAYPPTGQTLTSIPSLTVGKLVKRAMPVASNELELRTDDDQTLLWGREETIFSAARQLGLTTGVAGWAHPYCRVLAKDLDRCSWSHVSDFVPGQLNFRRAFSINFMTAALRVPLFFRVFQNVYEGQQRQWHATVFTEILNDADGLLRQRPNVTFLHYPIPHSPWIRDTRNNLLSQDDPSGYMDNVVLADSVLAGVRKTLEETGDWKRTIVVVSSDHWWRRAPLANGKRDHRVPFVLKLADQDVGMECKTPFNTVLTRELLTQLLRGDLCRPSEVLEWISRNSRLGESPLTVNLP